MEMNEMLAAMSEAQNEIDRLYGIRVSPFPLLPQRSKLLAAALIECHRFMRNRETVGRRKLFDAVNEAFSYLRD